MKTILRSGGGRCQSGRARRHVRAVARRRIRGAVAGRAGRPGAPRARPGRAARSCACGSPASNWSGASPGMWQFWQRGCCSTARTVSNAARPSFCETRGGGADRRHGERPARRRRRRATMAARLTRASAGAAAAACRSRRRRRWRRRARSAACPGSPTPPDFSPLGDDVHFDLRHLVHAQHRIVVEVATAGRGRPSSVISP